jgi:hypothetical protein
VGPPKRPDSGSLGQIQCMFSRLKHLRGHPGRLSVLEIQWKLGA